ncbi:uncharacterized protein LOC110863628 isoform X2 [Folsomia candida]|uniref:Uncharacterized protein n=1 Tax=Folsomia candida TaxID=158441 RepID=A0A226F3R9_FOLCA|nr:uncharacterized protein LOC110863628 isoform X2 [Folsomia candida]OXA64432.1 hypothetical protein Fcan01_02032 [Folsomia candida]
MNYSVFPSGVYSVPDVRLIRQGFYGERPTSFIRPGLPITPVNMLPYQGGSIPYGYTLVPNTTVVPQQRLMMCQPGIRTTYSVVDDDEDVDDYVPIRPKKRSQDVISEIMDSPEMDEFSAQTREIRRNADAVLQRLNTTKPTSRATDFFKSYDYDTRPLVQRYPSPLPERHLPRSSPYLEEDDEPCTSSWRSRGLNSSYPSSLRPCGVSSMSLTKDRIRSVYADLDEPVSYKTPKSYDFSHPDYSGIKTPRGSVQSEINRKAMLKEPSRSIGIGRSSSLRTPRERITQDASDVRNNISIRAHYAAMREAANRDVNIRKPKDIMP